MMKWATSILILLALSASISVAQTPTTFEGIDASQISKPGFDIDPNGSIGTRQFMEWVNVAYQGYDKVTFAPVWSTPQSGITPWKNAGLSGCYNISGDGVILFDRLASRWVVAGHDVSNGVNYYCIAVSNTDDLTSSTLAWYAYAFNMNSIIGQNSQGKFYFPDWPKLGTWADGYYLSMDLEDPSNNYQEVGVVACALDRTDMLIGATPDSPQCFKQPTTINGSLELGHSLIPADVNGTTPPPTGRDEFFVSIENPANDGVTTTSDTFNLWDFHVDWSNPANSTFTQSTPSVAPYTPGCYQPTQIANTICVPEPSTATTGKHIDSVGDRFMPRLDYRNFGSYESFLFSHTIQPGTSKQTGIRWYELRGPGTPTVYQDGTVNPDNVLYRFMPSIAQDSSGEATVGYSVSSSSTHPSIRASWWSLTNPTPPSEFSIFAGTGDEENASNWGDYTSMTVDPVDGCTFWYVDEYFSQNQTGTQHDWQTRIANFQLPGCGGVSLLPASGLSFGSVAVGSNAAQTATLVNNGSTTLTISNIGFTGANPGDFSQTNNCAGSLASGSSCQITVTFSPATMGSQSATLSVTDDANNSPQSIALTGTGITAVTLSTSSLNFGNVVIHTTSAAPAVTLTNNQSVPLTNISISAVAPFSETNTCGTSIAAGASCRIMISFTPTALGIVSGSVTITDSAANSPQSISVKGRGINPVTFAPGQLNFGTVSVGSSSSPVSTVLTNNQAVALTISSISIVGNDRADYSQANTCPSSLVAGGTCTITVTFTPRAKGTRTATIKVVDSASTSPQGVRLSGTGQ